MRRLRLAALLLCGAAACGRAPSNVSGAPVLYEAADGSYRCPVSGDWKVVEDDDMGAAQAVFFDPSRDAARTAGISIVRYPNIMDRRSDPKTYAAALAKQDGVRSEKRTLGGRTLTLFQRERVSKRLHAPPGGPLIRERIAVLPVPGGFYRLVHSAEADDMARTAPVFEAMLAGFEPLK